jgi:hypothetical protein
LLGTESWFSNDPYDLVSARPLAERCGVELSTHASSEEVQEKLWPIWGSEAGFETAIPGVARSLKLDGSAMPDPEVLNELAATGLLDEFGFRTVMREGAPGRPMVYLLLGTTANWTPRRVNLFLKVQDWVPFGGLFLLANSGRQCTLKTEVDNPDVLALLQELGRVPTEDELLVTTTNKLTGRQFERVHIDASNQAAQIRQLITELPVLAHGNLCVIANANATYIALQVRRTIREMYPDFDRACDQLYTIQDGFPLARTPEEAADAAHFQRPLTVFPGLVRMLTELCALQGV